MTIAPLHLILAGVCSFGCGLAGAGPAIVMVPLMNTLGASLELARSTGLLVNIAGQGASTVANMRRREVDFAVCSVITAASLVAAPAGAYLGGFLSRDAVNLALLLYLLAVLALLLRCGAREVSLGRQRHSRLSLGCIGAVSGVLAGVLGIGGGGVIIPAMILSGYDFKSAAVINSFSVCCSSVFGLATLAVLGRLDAWAATPLAISAFIGGYLGAVVMHRCLTQNMVRAVNIILTLSLCIKQAVSVGWKWFC